MAAGKPPTPATIRGIRRREQQEGCNLFEERHPSSLTLTFLDLEESGPPESYETRGQTLLTPANHARFERHINDEVAPDVVMLPCVYESPPEVAPDPMPSGPGNLGHFR